MPSSTDRDLRWLLAILLLTTGVYAAALVNDFTYDDRYFAVARSDLGPNLMVETLQPLGEYFQRPYGYGVSQVGRGFRPITVLSFALTHAIFGSDASDPAWPHHALNLLLHALGVWLVYRLTRRLTGPGPAALLAALVFGLHALRSDSVIAIVGRGELFGFAFGAAACLLHAASFQRAGARRVAAAASASALLFLAFGSKESAVAWAAFLPIFAFVDGRCRDRSAAIRLPSTFLAIGPPLLAWFLLREAMLAQHGEQFRIAWGMNPIFAADAGVRAPTATMLLGYGLWKVIAPFHLNADYGSYVFDLAESWLDPRVLLAAAALGGLLLGGVVARRRHPLLFLAAVVFLGFGFVTSNLWVPIETIFAERLYYTPALAASWAVAWLATRVPPGPIRNACAGILGVWLVVNGGLCVARCLDWRDNETLFTRDALSQPRSLYLQMFASHVYRDGGDRAEQARFLERALALDPQHAPALTELGRLRVDEGRSEEGRPLLRRALSPDAMGDHDARVALLWLALDEGDDSELARLLAAVRDRPPRELRTARQRLEDARLRAFRGALAYRQGRLADAIREFEASLRLLDRGDPQPRHAALVLQHVDALLRSGQRQRARTWVEGYLDAPHLDPELRRAFDRIARSLER
jgi:tetratricopeptide (TPR) repeat protein